MLEQAQAARKRVLGDMAQRRHAMHIQIEQFRAARDQLAAAVVGVRESVDRIVEDLARADDQAREAAARVARRPPPTPELGAEESALLHEQDLAAHELAVRPPDGEDAGIDEVVLREAHRAAAAADDAPVPTDGAPADAERGGGLPTRWRRCSPASARTAGPPNPRRVGPPRAAPAGPVPPGPRAAGRRR